MIRIKKAQNSVEFLIIFAFILALIGLVMFVTGRYLVDAQEKEKDMRAEDFADNINKELSILTQVDPGYYRELMISEDNYEILNISPSQLKILDKNNNKTYYFDLIGDYNVTSVNKTVNGEERVFLVFQKEQPENHIDGITLDEDVIVVTAPALPSSLDVLFHPSNTCPGGYQKLYAMGALTNAHGEVPSSLLYTYSLCLSHDDFALGTDCNAAINTTLFYLGNTTDSHVYTDTSTAYAEPYPGYYNWQRICVSSTGGVANVIYSDTEPNINYVCVGSIWIDDVNGGMIGDCSTPAIPPYTKIWLSIDIPNT